MSKKRTDKKEETSPKMLSTQDLVVLAADKDIKESIDGLLTKRTVTLGIRSITYTTITHPEHDPGCLNQSADLLRSYCKSHTHALVVFDHEGSGRDCKETRIQMESSVETALRKAGWDDRAATIVIDPELENWVWSSSQQIATCLGWNDPKQSLREWLLKNEFLAEGTQIKPARPKESMDAVLRHVKRPRSSAIYRAIAEKVSVTRCTDPAFQKLCKTLQTWFPIPDA